MTKLYSTLAGIYHEMYKQLFNYDEEHRFYDSILKKYNHHSILEIGCGSGMLARRFLAGGYDYTGLDLSSEMLDIARSEVETGKFVQGDMRNISLDQQFDSVLITGRSIAYNIENEEVADTFAEIHKVLNDNGLLIFDFFDADGVMHNLNNFEHEIQIGSKRICRTSQLKKNLKTGWTWDWIAQYTIEENGKKEEHEDFATLRAFTKDELRLFLKLAGFKVKRVLDDREVIRLIAEKA